MGLDWLDAVGKRHNYCAALRNSQRRNIAVGARAGQCFEATPPDHSGKGALL